MQWNVYYRQNINAVADFIMGMDKPPDIITGQEYTKNYGGLGAIDTAAFLAQKLGYHYCEDVVHVNSLSRNRDDEWDQSVVILSRLPMGEARVEKIHVPLDVDDPFDQFRSYLEVDVETDFGIVTTATAHTSTTSAERDPLVLNAEYQRFLAHTSGRKHYIFEGDLNAGEDSPIIRGISQNLVHAGPDYSEGSWPTYECLEAGVPVRENCRRYDYAFYSRDMAEQFNITSHFLDTPRHARISDHRILIVDLHPKTGSPQQDQLHLAA